MHLPPGLGDKLTGLTTMDVHERAPHWGMLGTVVWGVGIASAFVVLQTIAMVAYVTRGESSFTDGQLQALLEDSQNNGVVLSLVTLFSAKEIRRAEIADLVAEGDRMQFGDPRFR